MGKNGWYWYTQVVVIVDYMFFMWFIIYDTDFADKYLSRKLGHMGSLCKSR